MPVEIAPERINQIVMERLAQEDMGQRFAPRPDPAPPGPTTLSPTVAAILGALADSASTYAFLKNGGQEDNAVYGRLGNRPLPTALATLGTGLGAVGLAKLLGTRRPGLANTLLSGQAANQLGYAGENLDGGEETSSTALNTALVNEITRQKLLGR